MNLKKATNIAKQERLNKALDGGNIIGQGWAALNVNAIYNTALTMANTANVGDLVLKVNWVNDFAFKLILEHDGLETEEMREVRSSIVEISKDINKADLTALENFKSSDIIVNKNHKSKYVGIKQNVVQSIVDLFTQTDLIDLRYLKNQFDDVLYAIDGTARYVSETTIDYAKNKELLIVAFKFNNDWRKNTVTSYLKRNKLKNNLKQIKVDKSLDYNLGLIVDNEKTAEEQVLISGREAVDGFYKSNTDEVKLQVLESFISFINNDSHEGYGILDNYKMSKDNEVESQCYNSIQNTTPVNIDGKPYNIRAIAAKAVSEFLFPAFRAGVWFRDEEIDQSIDQEFFTSGYVNSKKLFTEAVRNTAYALISMYIEMEYYHKKGKYQNFIFTGALHKIFSEVLFAADKDGSGIALSLDRNAYYYHFAKDEKKDERYAFVNKKAKALRVSKALQDAIEEHNEVEVVSTNGVGLSPDPSTPHFVIDNKDKFNGNCVIFKHKKNFYVKYKDYAIVENTTETMAFSIQKDKNFNATIDPTVTLKIETINNKEILNAYNENNVLIGKVLCSKIMMKMLMSIDYHGKFDKDVENEICYSIIETIDSHYNDNDYIHVVIEKK